MTAKIIKSAMIIAVMTGTMDIFGGEVASVASCKAKVASMVFSAIILR